MRYTREIIIIFLFTISASFGSPLHHVPVTAEDQGIDIPLIGSSLFDKLFSIAKDGEAIYEVPYPIGKLMEKIESQRRDHIVHTMMPFSRSLQRPTGLDYKPLENPRLVFSYKYSDTAIERAKIFIGYVKKVDQLEIISFNDEAGRFEYQLVKDYSTNPKVFYVNRGKCLSCHQGQAPIFSVPGWQDTNTGVLGRLVGAKIGVKEPGTPAGRKKMAEVLFGDIPSLDAVGNFDALVREANDIALNERVWVQGCGDDDKCRLGLLLNTLVPNSISALKIFGHSKNRIEQSVLKEQNTYSSFLPPTDLGAVGIIFRYGKNGPGSMYENAANNDDAILEVINNIYKLTGAENPANRRRRDFTKEQLVPTSLSGFTFIDSEILDKEIKNLEEALLDLYQTNRSIFAKKAINKLRIMGTLLEKVGSKYAMNYLEMIDKRTPPKKLFTGPRKPVFQQKELNIFSRYCSECHGVGLSFPPQFLIGTENEVIQKIQNLKAKIQYKLENNLMPPNIQDRASMSENGDKDLLLKYILEFSL